MNLFLSSTSVEDELAVRQGYTFLGAAATNNADGSGEVHVFLKAGHTLAEPQKKTVDYVRIRITHSVSGAEFPYGHLSPENRSFIKEFLGEEFNAVRTSMNYYQLKNGYFVHVYNAFEIHKA